MSDSLPSLNKIKEAKHSDTCSVTSDDSDDYDEVEIKLPSLKFDANQFANQARMSRNLANELQSLNNLIKKNKPSVSQPARKSKLARSANSEFDLRYMSHSTIKTTFGIKSVYTSLEPTPKNINVMKGKSQSHANLKTELNIENQSATTLPLIQPQQAHQSSQQI